MLPELALTRLLRPRAHRLRLAPLLYKTLITFLGVLGSQSTSGMAMRPGRLIRLIHCGLHQLRLIKAHSLLPLPP